MRSDPVGRRLSATAHRRGGAIAVTVVAASLLAISLVAPAPAGAQGYCPPRHPGFGDEPCPIDPPRWTGELAVLGANAIVGGVTAGLAQRRVGGSFRDGFTRGFLGGTVVYGGKRVASERFPGAGLLGREVAAVGNSMVHNAAENRGTFDRLVLPVWIGRLYVDRDGAGGVRVTPRLDLMATFWTVHGVFEEELRFDAGRTLSAGTPVFMTDNRHIVVGGDDAGGVTAAGVLYLSDVPAFGEFRGPRLFAHERIHALQMDQIFLTWTRPLERALLATLPGGDRLSRYVDINLSTEFLFGLTLLFPEHGDRPWEIEAIYLAR
jgi:hypothetical protein